MQDSSDPETRRARLSRSRSIKRVVFKTTEATTDEPINTMVATTDNNSKEEIGDALQKSTDWYAKRIHKTEQPVTVTTREADMQQVVISNPQTNDNYQVFTLPTSKTIFTQKQKKPATVLVRKDVRSTSVPPDVVTGKRGIYYTNSHYLGGAPHRRIASPSPVRTFNLQKTVQTGPAHTTLNVVAQTPRHMTIATQPSQPAVNYVLRTQTQPAHDKPRNPVYHIQYIPDKLQYSHNDITDTARSKYSQVHVHSSANLENSPRYNPPSPGPVYTRPTKYVTQHSPPSPGPVYTRPATYVTQHSPPSPGHEYKATYSTQYKPPSPGIVYTKPTYVFSHQRASQYRPKILRAPEYSPNYIWNDPSAQRTHSWRMNNATNGEATDWITHDADNKAQTTIFDDDDANDAAVQIEVEQSFPSADVNGDVNADGNSVSYQQRTTVESVRIVDFVDPEGYHDHHENVNPVPPLSLSTPRSPEREVTMSLDEFLGIHGSNTSSHTSSLSEGTGRERRQSSVPGGSIKDP